MIKLSATFTKLAAILLVIAMLFSFAACGSKDNGNTTNSWLNLPKVLVTQDDTATEPATDPATNEDPSEDPSSEDPTAASDTQVDPSATDVSATDDTTVAASTTGTTKAGAPTGTKPGTTAPQTFKLNSKQEMLNYYNTATKNAQSNKSGFHKERIGAFTSDPKIPKAVLAVFPDAMDLVCKFMSIDKGPVSKSHAYIVDTQKGVAPNKKHPERQFLQESKLTINDIKDISYTMSGDNAVITIKLKDGKSDKNTDITKLPLEKCGICSGNYDHSDFDHQNAVIMFDAVDAGKFNEAYSNAVIKATINTKTGQFTDLKITFHTDVDINLIVNIKAAGNISVHYTKFKY